MTGSSALSRSAAAALLLLLAVRLLSPAGFMPVFDHGSVVIVACPDSGPVPTPMAHHHHHGDSKLQQHCPYAAGTAPANAAELALIVVALLVAAALVCGRPFESFQRLRLHDHPPARGPPLLA
jgi:UDP-N-acetylmuramyl pentapeptide phosphotransferase/UDP-N-acetylglucosamine-1-phosphate transferase